MLGIRRATAITASLAFVGLCLPIALAQPFFPARVARADGTVTRLPWDDTTQGLPVMAVGQHDVWIGSINATPAAPAVWRVDPARATVRATPLTEQVLDIFPGDGTLWVSALPLDGNGLLLYWVDIAHGFRLVAKAVPRTCQIEDGGHSAVYGGRLWLTCHRYGIYVFAPGERQPVQRIQQRSVAALLPASHGLWAASEQSLRAVAGRSRGATIPLPRGFVAATTRAPSAGRLRERPRGQSGAGRQAFRSWFAST